MAAPVDPDLDNRKEAVKTQVEQAKLLVALASAFVIAPAAAVVLSGTFVNTWLFVFGEVGLVASVLLGYLVLGAIAGSQFKGDYDVYRQATIKLSLAQIGSYLVGLILFVAMCKYAMDARREAEGKTAPQVSTTSSTNVAP